MLIQHLPLLCTKRVVLASASPRRSELLRGLVSFLLLPLRSLSMLSNFAALDLALDEVVCASRQGLKFEVLPSTFEENLDKSVFANPGGTGIPYS